jgi:hypothetical protein
LDGSANIRLDLAAWSVASRAIISDAMIWSGILRDFGAAGAAWVFAGVGAWYLRNGYRQGVIPAIPRRPTKVDVDRRNEPVKFWLMMALVFLLTAICVGNGVAFSMSIPKDLVATRTAGETGR